MLTPGSTLGPYRIDREIGRGGMGVIFLAQDTRLGRPAAIKALPEDVASDPERMARFEREAKALASLTHPNVAGIYGLEESEGRKYLALEYVEGESLADRLQRGPLSAAETIEFGLQIAAGIEAAHEAGIVHRDLKPANIVITSADQAKVLDFGLAKGRVAEGPSASSPTNATSPTAHSPTLLHSPTIQTPATMPGVILGTAAYLSPEQARGKVVDRRTDIWSFGCVLWECLTGKLTFDGETVSDTIAKILERDVNWSALPPSTPAALRALLARCLEKDPKRRLRDIGDARLALEELKAGRSSAALAAAGVTAEGAAAALDPAAAKAQARASARRRNLFAAVAFVAGAALSLLAWNLWRPAGGSSSEILRLSIAVPEHLRATGLQTTDDGRTIIIRALPRNPASGEEAIAKLYVRKLESEEFTPLAGTERVTAYRTYPDGKWICFLQPVSERSSEMKIMKARLDGSAPASELGRWERSWTPPPLVLESGELLAMLDRDNSYIRIPAAGGTPSGSKKVEVAGAENAIRFVEALPGDRGILLATSTYRGNVFQQGVAVFDLKSGKAKVLLSDAGSPRYSPTGHLLFSRQSTLFAVPFDLGKLEVKGAPTAILGGLRTSEAWSNGNFGSARGRTLVYPPGGFVGKDRRLVLIEPDGRATDWSSERLPFEVGVFTSPDGSKATSIVATPSGIYEIWISERNGGSARRFIAREGADLFGAIWSRDGSRVAYSQVARGEADGLYTVDASGTGAPRRFVKMSLGEQCMPNCWTPDGSRVLFTRFRQGRQSVFAAEVEKPSQSIGAIDSLFAGESGNHALAMISPDGRLLTYVSDESGQFELYVRAWNGTAPEGPAISIGKSEFGWSTWSADSRKVVYVDDRQRCVQVEIVTQPRLGASAPRVLWSIQAAKTIGTIMAMTPDGRVLAIRKSDAEDDVTQFDFIVGFPELLKQRLRQAGGK